MFDTKVGFFDNKNHRTECDKKLKKLKNHFKAKDVIYKLELSPRESYMQPCPLELKPTKLSETSLDFQPKRDNEKLKKSCTKRKKNITTKNIGRKQESVDDSILTGLQTVIDLCGLLEQYEERDRLKHATPRNKKKMQEQHCFDNSHELDFFPNSSGDSLPHDESHDSSRVYKPSNKPSQFCRLLTRASRSRTKNKFPNRYSNNFPTPHPSVTPAQPSILSSYNQSFQILNTSTHQSICSQTALINQPEERLQFVFTKPCSVDCNNPNVQEGQACEECRAPCKECQIPCNESQVPCKVLQSKSSCHKCPTPEVSCEEKCAESPAVAKVSKVSLRRRSQEDDINHYWSKRNLSIQVAQAGHLEQPHEVSKKKKKKKKVEKSPSLESITMERPSRTNSLMGLVGPPLCHSTPHTIHKKDLTTLSAKYFPPMEIVPATCHLVHPKITGKRQCTPNPMPHPAMFKPVLCNEDFTEPLKKEQLDCRKSRHGIPLVQPVIGFCNSGKCGSERVKSIKYAMVKISEFASFNTYEIMKPYNQKPKNMPTCISEIFVTSGRPKKEGVHRRRSCSHTHEVIEEPYKHRSARPEEQVFKSSGTLAACKEPPTCSKHSISQNTEPVVHRNLSVCSREMASPVHDKDISKITVPPTIIESNCRTHEQSVSKDPIHHQSVISHKQPPSICSGDINKTSSQRASAENKELCKIGSGQPVKMTSTTLPEFTKCEEPLPIKPCSRQEISLHNAPASSRVSFNQSTKPVSLEDHSTQKSAKKRNLSEKKNKSASKTSHLKSSSSKNAGSKGNTILYLNSSGIQQSSLSNKHNETDEQSFYTASFNNSNTQPLYHCVHIGK